MALEKILKNSSGVPTGEYERIAGGTLWADAPIGTIFPFLSSSIPAGFLLCDGTAYPAASYPELWAILPDTVKDTTNNTFTIDLRETTLKGAGLTGETVGAHLDADGLAVGEFLDDRVQSHTHAIRPNGSGVASLGSNGMLITGATLNDSTGQVSTGRSGATTEVKSRGVNFIIKAKMVAMPSDFMSKVDEAVSDMFLVVNDAIGATGTLTANQDLRINMPTPPTGYKYFCCDFKGTGNNTVLPRAWASDAVYIHNTTNSNQSYDVTIDITYIKSN